MPEVPAGASGDISCARFVELDLLSDELTASLLQSTAQFMHQNAGLTQSEKTYVIFSAATAMCAGWYCRPDMIAQTFMNMPEAMQLVVQLLQNNFAERQHELYDRIGRYTH